MARSVQQRHVSWVMLLLSLNYRLGLQGTLQLILDEVPIYYTHSFAVFGFINHSGSTWSVDRD